MGTLLEDLRRGADRVWETHISWVFGVGDEVLKVKKPVALGFLDFSTPERRRAACEAEDRLNRRLASDVYRGVVPVTRDRDGVHRVDGSGEVVDWAVRMRRLDDRHRGDVLLETEGLGVAEMDRLAARIAAFHDGCRADADTAAFGARSVIAANVRENFEQTRDALDVPPEPIVSAEVEREIERAQLDFLEANEALLAQRAANGRVRDGHGDLRLEHVYLEPDGEVRVIDCIEFNERFRYADVCADVAFLSMDLAFRGRVDLAERLLATYARDSNDFDLYALVDFYESYRAYVRGKIATMIAADPANPGAVKERARADARRYLLYALAAERRPIAPPLLVAIGGPIASGKSTVADRLGAALGAPHINTDRVRKHLLGARPTEKLYDGSWSGAYDVGFTDRVYAEVARLARVVLDAGRTVILDASFRSRSMRAMARDVAASAGVPFRFVECRAPVEVCRERLARRDMETSVSDGRLEIFDDFLARWEAVDELAAGEHLVADTTRPLDAVVETLAQDLASWPQARFSPGSTS